jgi:hypothetical protein
MEDWQIAPSSPADASKRSPRIDGKKRGIIPHVLQILIVTSTAPDVIAVQHEVGNALDIESMDKRFGNLIEGANVHGEMG